MSLTYYIYKITDKQDANEYYIGSTVNINTRKAHHKKNVTNKVSRTYWCKIYQYIRAKGGWNNFEFEVLETGQYVDKKEIKQKEQEYITRFNPTLNSVRACKKTI